MEQDLEDFNIWDASELDQLASDIFAENLQLFSSDGDPRLSNLVDSHIPTASIPVGESANLNTESAVLPPSLDQFNDYNQFFGASELPAPTQTTSPMQVPHSAGPSEDELFRFVNLDSDASYTDRYPPESLAPIATAESVPVAQSTDLTENDMSAVDDMDLDPHYENIDFSHSLAPTISTGLVQATQSVNVMKDGTSRIIELDPDPVMTSSGPAPTGSEQLPPLVSTDRVLPAEVAKSVNPQMVFNGSGPPNPSYLTPQPQPFAVASREITTTMPPPGNQLRPKSGNSLPSGGYRPIRPKPAATSRIAELPSTNEPQDSSRSRIPSQGTLASGPASSVSKGKRKRLRSPQPRPGDIPKDAPKDCFREFRVTEQSEAAKEKGQRQPVAKRTRTVAKKTRPAKSCLRCSIQKLPCSGGFPCNNCVGLFGRQAVDRPRKTLQWKHCFTSDIMELDFFTDVSLIFSMAQDFVSSKQILQEKCRRTLWMRGIKAADLLINIAESSTMETGISHLIGLQVARFVQAGSRLRVPPIPPLVSMHYLLPRQPLRRHKMCSHYHGRHRSYACRFAVTVLQRDFLAELAGFSRQEILHFTNLACCNFNILTARLLTKAKTETMSSEDKATLIQHLETIYSLITLQNVQVRLTGQFAMAVIENVDTIRSKVDAENPTVFPKLRPLQLCRSFLKEIKGGGWEHLQAFTRHWLRRLGGHNSYSEVILSYLQLDTLCRINRLDKIEDEGRPPPNFGSTFDSVILDEAYKAFSTLLQPGDPAHNPFYNFFEPLRRQGHRPHCHARLFRELSSVVKWIDSPERFSINSRKHPLSMDYQHAGNLLVVAALLDAMERAITKKNAEKGLKRPKDYRMIPPDDVPDDPLDPTDSGRNPLFIILEECEKL